MTTDLTFEDRLLNELRRVVAATPAPPVARRGHALPRRLALPAAAAAAAGAGALLIFVGGGGSAAYAVDAQPDGSVTVHISSLSDASGLQSALRARGIPAVVDYTPNCAPAPGAAGAPAPPPQAGGTTERHEVLGLQQSGVQKGPAFEGAKGHLTRVQVSTRIDGGGVTFTIDPQGVPTGQKLFITTSTGQADAIGISIGTTAKAGCPSAP